MVSGKAPSPGDVLLEVNGTPVSGLTNRDTLAVIRHFREPIRLKTVKPGVLSAGGSGLGTRVLVPTPRGGGGRGRRPGFPFCGR